MPTDGSSATPYVVDLEDTGGGDDVETVQRTTTPIQGGERGRLNGPILKEFIRIINLRVAWLLKRK